jgi:hypothetical protein
MNPHQRDALRAAVLLDDLVRDPHERSPQIIPVEDWAFQRAPSWPLWTRLKEPTGRVYQRPWTV